MLMTAGVRKIALTTHITSSVGWLGSVAAFLALAIAGVTSGNAQTVRAAYLAMHLTTWFVIVPLSLASLLTGLVDSLGTPWGLFRHYWVVITLVLTIFSTVILLLHMPTVSALAAVVREAEGAHAAGLGGDLVHAGGGLLVLLVITALNVYKPRGMTPYGWRKQHEQQTSSS